MVRRWLGFGLMICFVGSLLVGLAGCSSSGHTGSDSTAKSDRDYEKKREGSGY